MREMTTKERMKTTSKEQGGGQDSCQAGVHAALGGRQELPRARLGKSRSRTLDNAYRRVQSHRSLSTHLVLPYDPGDSGPLQVRSVQVRSGLRVSPEPSRAVIHPLWSLESNGQSPVVRIERGESHGI